MFKEFLSNVIKGFAHASAGGGIAVGTGLLNLQNVDFPTIVTLVVIATLYNMVREAIKKFVNVNI